jgi:hypothetical protein
LTTSKIIWQVIHECFYDTDDDYSESGIDIKILSNSLIVRSFVYNGFEGNSTMSSYHLSDGSLIYHYSNTRGEINGIMRNQQSSLLDNTNDTLKIKNDRPKIGDRQSVSIGSFSKNIPVSNNKNSRQSMDNQKKKWWQIFKKN